MTRPYQSYMLRLMASVAVLCGMASIGPSSTRAAQILHYWDMDTVDIDGVPQDVAGGVSTTAANLVNLQVNQNYGVPYAGAGNSLQTLEGGSTATIPSTHLLADVVDAGTPTAMDFGLDSFSFSYWSYKENLTAERGPGIFDNLQSTDEGIQLGTNGTGVLNLRVDDGAGSTVSTTSIAPAINQVGSAWTHVAINVDRDNNLLEVFFGGASQGSLDISALTGTLSPTYDLRIGVTNEGNSNNSARNSALDDLAFYSGLLTQSDISGLAAGTLSPTQIPEPSTLVMLLGFGLAGMAATRRVAR